MSLIHRINATVRSLCSLNRNREFAILRRLVRENSNGVLLDIGSGDGFWTDRFSRDFQSCYGLEPDRIALQLAQKVHADHVQYVHGVAESLGFDDDQFDCVVSVSCFEHFRSAQAALHEAFRVLKPGGRIAISVDSLVPANSSNSFRDWHRKKYFVTEYLSEERLAKMIRDAGFDLESENTVELIASPLSACVRECYLRHPRALLPAFPFLYLLVLLGDRWGRHFPGQIIVMSARKPTQTGSMRFSPSEIVANQPAISHIDSRPRPPL